MNAAYATDLLREAFGTRNLASAPRAFGSWRAALGMDLLEAIANPLRDATASRASKQGGNLRLRAGHKFRQLILRKAGGEDFGYGSLWVHGTDSITFALIGKLFYRV